MNKEKVIENLGIWIAESDFDYKVDEDDMVEMIGFASLQEQEDTLNGMTHEVLALFLEWCALKLGYEAYSIEAMVKDFLEIPQNERIKYWEAS